MSAEEDAVLAVIDIDGWFFPDEIRLLYRSALDAIRRFPGLPIVEIGSYKGRSTIVLASAVRDSGDAAVKVCAIDPHKGNLTGMDVAPTWTEFLRNTTLSGVGKFIVPYRCTSEEANCGTPISLLFIDGLHTETGVTTDYRKFYQYVPVGGMIAFHDYDNPDHPAVQLFVDKEISSGRLEICGRLEARPGNTLLVTRKLPRLSIIIPTCGRESLNDVILSIFRNGGTKVDEILVVGDGPQPMSRRIAGLMSSISGFPEVRYFEHGPHRQTGGPQRNFGMTQATGTHLIAIDDDDLYVNDALTIVRQAILEHPLNVLLFKEESKVVRHSWGVVWKDKEIRRGNVGTQMVVAPNIPGRVGQWGSTYENDYDFIRSTVDLLPRKDADVVWIDRVIVELH